MFCFPCNNNYTHILAKKREKETQKEKKADEGKEGWRDNKLRSLLLNDSDSPSGHPFSLSVLLICRCVCEDMHKEEASVCVQKRWEDVKYRGRDNAAMSVRGGLSQWHQPSGTPPNLVGFNVHIKIKNGVFVWKHLDFFGGYLTLVLLSSCVFMCLYMSGPLLAIVCSYPLMHTFLSFLILNMSYNRSHWWCCNSTAGFFQGNVLLLDYFKHLSD